MATAELHWAGTKSASTVSGDVLVTKLAVTPGFDFASYLERSRQSGAITPANSRLYNVKLDVGVRTAPELQMKTAVARLSGDADLRLRGSLARPSVLGRADILEVRPLRHELGDAVATLVADVARRDRGLLAREWRVICLDNLDTGSLINVKRLAYTVRRPTQRR